MQSVALNPKLFIMLINQKNQVVLYKKKLKVQWLIQIVGLLETLNIRNSKITLINLTKKKKKEEEMENNRKDMEPIKVK